MKFSQQIVAKNVTTYLTYLFAISVIVGVYKFIDHDSEFPGSGRCPIRKWNN